MTFDERLAALGPLGFTPRQTRFLVTAALHSGYCLRRQYAAFAGVRYGKNVRDFLEALVHRQLAQRVVYQPNRGHVYHLHATALYRALGQRDNRNRRHVSAAVIARKLMLLDYVLQVSEGEWYATEDDKVALFNGERGIALADLPQRMYASTDWCTEAPTRYFMHKLPIYLAPDRAVVQFVYLVNDETGHGLAQFLRDHARLFSALPAWTVVAICPRGLNGLAACRTMFDEFVATTWRPTSPEGVSAVRWFFATRQLVERGDLRALSVADLDRFQEARRRFSNAHLEARYAAWLTHGERALAPAGDAALEIPAPTGQLILRELPSAYTQFGSWPGVC
jgi:hypothetical protein